MGTIVDFWRFCKESPFLFSSITLTSCGIELNKLEAIIADADLEYWGSAKTNETAEKLFKELQTLNPQHTRDEWNKQQIGFLQNHQYFTNYCKALKEPFEQAHLKKLIEERNASVFK